MKRAFVDAEEDAPPVAEEPLWSVDCRSELSFFWETVVAAAAVLSAFKQPTVKGKWSLSSFLGAVVYWENSFQQFAGVSFVSVCFCTGNPVKSVSASSGKPEESRA